MNSLPAQPRLRISAVVAVLLLAGGMIALGVYGSLGWLPFPSVPVVPGITEQTPQEVTQLPGAFTKQANQYGGVAVAQAIEKPQIVQTIAEPPPPTPDVKEQKLEEGWLQKLGIGPTPIPQRTEPAQPHQAQPAQAKPASTPKEPPAKKPRWELLAVAPEGQATATPQTLLAAANPAQGTPETARQEGKLIQPARWEIPANPLRTIYRSQTLTGVLLQAVHSDIPGQVKIQLTTPVLDKFGYDTTILPKDTLVIAAHGGRSQYGNTRLPLTIDQLELPSGEVIELRATVGDEAGSSGVKAKVNNHLGKVILATGLSALLNIGVRTAVGTPSAGQFFQSPLQDAAQDVGQAVQRDATSIIDRELRIPPTLTIKAGTFCSINLQENMTFNRPPLVAR